MSKNNEFPTKSTAELILELQKLTVESILNDISSNGFTKESMDKIASLKNAMKAAEPVVSNTAEAKGFKKLPTDKYNAYEYNGVKFSIGRGYSNGTSMHVLLLDDSYNFVGDDEYCVDTFDELAEQLPSYDEYKKILSGDN